MGVTDNLDGLGLVPVAPDDALRCGMRDGVVSSVLSNDNVDPCRDEGFEPCLLRGREFGFEFGLEALGVRPVLTLV